MFESWLCFEMFSSNFKTLGTIPSELAVSVDASRFIVEEQTVGKSFVLTRNDRSEQKLDRLAFPQNVGAQ